MPEPAAVTHGFRTQLLAIRGQVGLSVNSGLASIDYDLAPDRLRADLFRWATAAAALVETGQNLGAHLASTYMAAWLAAAGVVGAVPAVDVAARVGTVPADVPGSTLDDAMRRAATSVLWRLNTAPRPMAVRYGQYAATRVAWTGVQDNATGVLDDLIAAHPQIVGWRRITSPTACDRCVLAAARLYKPRTEPLKRRHPSCRCTQGPVLGT